MKRVIGDCLLVLLMVVLVINSVLYTRSLSDLPAFFAGFFAAITLASQIIACVWMWQGLSQPDRWTRHICAIGIRLIIGHWVVNTGLFLFVVFNHTPDKHVRAVVPINLSLLLAEVLAVCFLPLILNRVANQRSQTSEIEQCDSKLLLSQETNTARASVASTKSAGD